MTARIYRGVISHARTYPVEHAFAYPTWMLCLSLAELEHSAQSRGLLGYNQRRLCSIWDRDYLEPTSTPLAVKLARYIDSGEARLPAERIWLLTVPRVFMLGFNPLSLFVYLDALGRIETLVVEVHNTYKEGHLYVLRRDDPSTLTDQSGIHFRFPKAFFVSPFNGLEGEYRLSLQEPFDRESLLIHLDLFTASRGLIRTALRLNGETLNTRRLAATVARYPFTAALTLPRIAHQALVLRWRRKLTPRIKPLPTDRMTVRRAHKPQRAWLRDPLNGEQKP